MTAWWWQFGVYFGVMIVVGVMWFKMGKAVGSRRESVSPTTWAGEVEIFLRELLTPPSIDTTMNDLVMLPDATKATATRLLMEAPGAAASRAQKRRTGY